MDEVSLWVTKTTPVCEVQSYGTELWLATCKWGQIMTDVSSEIDSNRILGTCINSCK